MIDEKCIMRMIKNFSFNRARLGEIAEQLKTINYISTPNYGGIGNNVPFSSKVEIIGILESEIKERAMKYKNECLKVQDMINNSGLDDIEKKILWCIANNDRLAALARREGITVSNIYYIRDRAIKKIAQKKGKY